MQVQLDLMKMYNASFKSKLTARAYQISLMKYSSDLPSLLKMSQRDAEDTLIHFIITNKEAGMSWAALHNYVVAVSKFYLINDLPLNLKRVNRFMPEHIKLKKDRGYKQEEILKLLELANERTRALVLLLASTGVRLGAIPSMTMRHLESRGDIYKITVYENTNQEYFTYCTPECKRALETYFQVRERHGETITSASPVIREQYDKRSDFSARHPRPTTRGAITFLLKEITELVGLRARIPRTEPSQPTPKKDVMLAHGFRKFFSSQLVEADLKTERRWLLEGHNLKGNDPSYVRVSEKRLQEEYMKAIDLLTIDPANRLKRELVHEQAKNTETSKILARLVKLEGEVGIKI